MIDSIIASLPHALECRMYELGFSAECNCPRREQVEALRNGVLIPREQIARLSLACAVSPAEFKSQQEAEAFWESVCDGISEACDHWLGEEFATPVDKMNSTGKYIVVGNKAAEETHDE